MIESHTENEPTSEPGSGVESKIRCDICGDEALSVHRVALHGDYDRLRKPHQVLYACPPCSEKKERQRLGFERNSTRS